MISKASTPDAYLAELPEERKEAISKLRAVISDALPEGFREEMSYGMIGYVVPHEHYPEGYHCDPSLPLPFINLASQKNHIGLYHMGLYSNKEMLNWFINSHKEATGRKPDMGKSCIRFKRLTDIPYALVSELCSKMTVTDWINQYESEIKR